MGSENDKSKSRYGVLSYNFENAGRGPALYGLLFIIPILIVAGAWSALAPLNSAAIANGEVVLNFERKVVQHLEGGIVEEIMITEGQFIKKDQPILIIRDLPQRAQINTLYDQLAGARSLYARLWAELHDHISPNFDEVRENIELSDAKFEKLVSLQTRLFDTRRSGHEAKTKIIRSSQEQSRKEIEGLKAQLISVEKQHELVNGEYKNIAGLLEQGLALNTRKVEMERGMAELEGQIGSLIANIARIEQTISAGDLQIVDAQNELNATILDELQRTELSIQEMTHQLVSIRDQLNRSTVRAPASGRVLNLQIHTRGAVVAPGQKILDIVPQDDRLVIEARLNPNDIDIVKQGTKAKILLSAYKAKNVPKIDGEVIDVSGDILTDEVSGERFFATKILVDDSIFSELKNDIELYPGMPAQVFLIEGERTVADYLLSPIMDAMYRAFREE